MGLNCIIIDDSLFIRQTVQQLIEQAGHQVIASFSNGPEFLNSITSNESNITPDVVFCDIILPEMTGLDLLTLITEGFPAANIIMLSGVTQTDAISAALRLGAIDFLQKPVEKERLIELLSKLSSITEIPSVEELSTIGVMCEILSGFFDELTAHSSSTLRKVVDQQIMGILKDIDQKTDQMFSIDISRAVIQPDPNLWGIHGEEEVMNILKSIPQDLKFELQFLYSDDFVQNLYDQAIMTMGAKKRFNSLFSTIPPHEIGLPPLPDYSDPSQTKVTMAGTTFEELNKAISIAFFVFDLAGPQIQSRINHELLSEPDLMKNSIFYYTLVGDDDNVQEGLFGPLPVSSSSGKSLSSLAYTTKKLTRDNQKKIIILSLFYTPQAERIVSDYNKLSFIIRTRLAPLDYVDDIDKVILRGILDDTIDYLLGN